MFPHLDPAAPRPRAPSNKLLVLVSLCAALLCGCSVMATTNRTAAGAPGAPEATVASASPAPASADWPQHACDAQATAASFTGANYRPRLLDQVGETLPFALLMPVDGAVVAEVYPSFGDPRSGGRMHEGVDIMAPRGTPVRPAAPGFVTRLSTPDLGGISVTLLGDGGVRYFYTHLDAIADGLEVGQFVDPGAVIGYVGNTGNAASTAPHLHFGVYMGSLQEWCGWQPVDPLPLLIDRDQL